MPEDKTVLPELIPAIGEFVVTQSALESGLERILHDWKKPFERGYVPGVTGEYATKLTEIFEKEIALMISGSPHVSEKEKEVGRIDLERICGQILDVIHFRNTIIHGVWYEWTKKYPIVMKSTPERKMQSASNRDELVSLELLRKYTELSQTLDKQIHALEDKYKRGHFV
jgi:hypothetical protein